MLFPIKFSGAKQAQLFEKFAAQREVLLTICLQHETDHLNGKLVTDSPFRHSSASFMRRDCYLQWPGIYYSFLCNYHFSAIKLSPPS
jgi:hypothetical protein